MKEYDAQQRELTSLKASFVIKLFFVFFILFDVVKKPAYSE